MVNDMATVAETLRVMQAEIDLMRGALWWVYVWCLAMTVNLALSLWSEWLSNRRKRHG